MSLQTRIMLADDHAVVRRGLRLVLEGEPDLRVVAEVGDGAEAVERGLHEDVDLAVLDISMPRMTGLQAARELTNRRDGLRVLILSMHDNEQYLFEALRAGGVVDVADDASELQHHAREALADAVVQLLRDAQPLALLRGERAADAGATLVL